MEPDPICVIPKMIAATLNLLNAAANHEGVKRLVLTSSSTAAFISKQNEACIVTEGISSCIQYMACNQLLTLIPDSWNHSAVQAAWSEGTPAEQKPFLVYAASKTEAERAAWTWVQDNKPGFVLNTVLPCLNVSLSCLLYLRI